MSARPIPAVKILWADFYEEENGQDLIEYALLLGFLALATVAMVTSLGVSINTLFQDVSKTLINAAPSAS